MDNAQMPRYEAKKYIPNGRTLGIFTSRQDAPQRLHCHDFIELVYITAGSALQQVDGADYQVSRGDMLFINYGATHAFVPQEGFRYINICFLPELLCDAITRENALALLSLTAFDDMRQERSGGMLSFSGLDRKEVEFILRAMLREQKKDEPYADQVLTHYLNILLTKMLRPSAQALQEESDLWQELERYICDNLQEPLTLELLARRCFYNPSYFSRTFKQKMGCSLSSFIREKRIAEAQRLLRETERSLDEIAACVGYSDRSAFCHVFARAVGMSPTEYRSKNHPGG